MTGRRRGLLAALGAAILLLFAGRWAASFLADRWWAAAFSPAARDALTRWHLFRLAIDAAAVLAASGWFIGHLLILGRALRSVQVPRHVGNIEFRETLRPELLVGTALVAGGVLGLVIGLDMSAYWPVVALAWRGVTTGVVEPVLGHDAGLYLAQLPFWRMLHEYAFLLVVVGLALVLTLYTIVGAIRIERRRPAINDHARNHLGWLLAGLALVLAWGYLLEPLELVAGIGGAQSLGAVRRSDIVAPALVGTALMVAVLSALWALRPRHALAAAGWAVLTIASIGGHYLAPMVLRVDGAAPAADSAVRALERTAFGLATLRTDTALPAIAPAPLLDEAGVARLFPAPDDVVSVDAATVEVGGRPRAAWLALVSGERTGAQLVAIAADSASAGGGALFYRESDSLAYPTPYPFAAFAPGAVRPGAARYQVATSGRGVALGAWPKRALLAWALQAGDLLGPTPAGASVDWSLDPAERLTRLAPFAAWSSVRARMVGGRVLWLADGYVTAETFPLVPFASWSGGSANMVRAGFFGVVDAANGSARIFLRDHPDSVSVAWSRIATGVVEPFTAMPLAVADAAGYPEALFAIQAALIARRPGAPGELVVAGTPPGLAVHPAWDSAGSRLLLAAFGAGDRVTALLTGAGDAGGLSLSEDASGLPVPRALERSWGRFATFAPVQDSVTAAAGRIETGPVRFWRSPDGLAAMQVHTAARQGARPVIVWVSVATGRRLGAGRSFQQAWDNLLGTSAPLPPGTGGGQPAEARHWMRIADEALKRGDWATFGRAFDALRRVLMTDPP